MGHTILATSFTLTEYACLPEPHRLQSVMTCPSARSTYLLMDLLDCDLHTFLEHAPIASELRVIKVCVVTSQCFAAAAPTTALHRVHPWLARQPVAATLVLPFVHSV